MTQQPGLSEQNPHCRATTPNIIVIGFPYSNPHRSSVSVAKTHRLMMTAQRLLILTILLPLTVANIPVNYKVTLSCNQSSPFYTGCLRGMTCEDDWTCSKPAVKVVADPLFFLEATHLSRRQAQPPMPSESTEPQISAPAPAPAPAAGGPVTTDGTCGAGNGGTICGDWPQGGCCSLYGVSSARLKGNNI